MRVWVFAKKGVICHLEVVWKERPSHVSLGQVIVRPPHEPLSAACGFC